MGIIHQCVGLIENEEQSLPPEYHFLSEAGRIERTLDQMRHQYPNALYATGTDYLQHKGLNGIRHTPETNKAPPGSAKTQEYEAWRVRKDVFFPGVSRCRLTVPIFILEQSIALNPPYHNQRWTAPYLRLSQ